MNTALTITYIITVILLIATPGPVVALVVNTASVAGPRKALSTALGTNWASLALIALASYIIISSAAINNMLLSILSLLGCLFIGYVAVGALRDAMAPDGPDEQAGGGGGGMWQGFMVGISNPKDIIFFISFFPQFIQITTSVEKSLALLSLLWVVIDLLVLGAYILIISKLSHHANSRLIALCSGSALLLIAVLGLIYNVHGLLSAAV